MIVKMKTYTLFVSVSTLVALVLLSTAIFKGYSHYHENHSETIGQIISDEIEDVPQDLPVPTTELPAPTTEPPIQTTVQTNNHKRNKDEPAWMNLDAEAMSAKDLMEYFAWTNSSSCRFAHVVGRNFDEPSNEYDGENTVCILPKAVAPTFLYCLVYSFGISNEWRFEDAMEKGLGCEVFTFDPSIEEAKERYDRNANIHFLKLGLGRQNETSPQGWKLRTLGTIRRMLGHEFSEIDYLKFEIEENEWDLLAEMIETGEFYQVKQISLKIHLPCCESPVKEYQKIARVLRIMEQDYNMVRFSSEPDPLMKHKFPLLNNREMYFSYEMAWYNSTFLDNNKKDNK